MPRKSPGPRHRSWSTLLLAAAPLWVGCASTVHYQPVAGPTRGEDEPLDAALYLVGDAGEDSPGRAAVLDHLSDDLDRMDGEHSGTPVLVAFLGDNIYDVGAREAHKEEDFAHLAAQVGVLQSTGARAVFLPGNHDWAKGAEDERALEAVSIQERWLGELVGEDRATFRPSDGCPGPAGFDLGPGVRLVFIDTEWLLRRPATACGSADDFYAALAEELSRHADDRIILAAHHPLATGGPHGGNVSAFYRGPLVYYLAVKAGLSVQDLASGRYSDMLAGLRRAILESGVQPLAFASGHDHSLQVIRMRGRENPAFQLVSGSGSKTSPVDRVDGTRYAASAHGYMRVDFGPEQVGLTVFAQVGDDPTVRAVFHCTLVPADDASCAEAPRLVDP